MKSSESGNADVWNADTVTTEVVDIVRSKAQAPVSLNDSFDSLGLDSLAMAEVVFELESTFRIHTDERLLNVRSLGQVVDYVLDAIRKQHAPR